MKHFTIGTCHEIGRKWTIDAPDDLSNDCLEKFIRALCDENDSFDNIVVPHFVDTYARELVDDYDIYPLSLPKLKEVRFTLEVVHRDIFVNSIEENK